MSPLLSYRNQPTFHADDLIEIVNKLLKPHGAHPFTKRALRYYISEGILPPAIGPTKFARYSHEHLVGILAIRMLQLQGCRLHEAIPQLKQWMASGIEQLEHRVNNWLKKSPLQEGIVREMPKPYQAQKEARILALHPSTQLRRIQLTPHIYIDVVEGADLETELQKAQKALQELIKECKGCEESGKKPALMSDLNDYEKL